MDRNRYGFSVDPDRKLVRAKGSGLFSSADVEGYFEAERAAVASIGCSFGEHLLLVDATEFTVQQQAIVSDFQQRLRAIKGARRAALVSSSALSRMQTGRILAVGSAARVFDNMAEAEAWLFSE